MAAGHNASFARSEEGPLITHEFADSNQFYTSVADIIISHCNSQNNN